MSNTVYATEVLEAIEQAPTREEKLKVLREWLKKSGRMAMKTGQKTTI